MTERALATMLASCGFHLRGQAALPFKAVFIETSGYSQFANDLERAIRSGSDTKVVRNREDADAILKILSEGQERRILSLSLPYLSTDRLHRQMRGRSWRCQPALPLPVRPARFARILATFYPISLGTQDVPNRGPGLPSVRLHLGSQIARHPANERRLERWARADALKPVLYAR